MFTLTVLGSGSAGNCALIASDHCRLLIDAGLSARQIVRRLEAVGGPPPRPRPGGGGPPPGPARRGDVDGSRVEDGRRVGLGGRSTRTRSAGSAENRPATPAQPDQAESRSRPLRRRPAMIARPARVRIRSRKPCVRARRRLFGWKVRLPLLTVDSPGRRRGTMPAAGLFWCWTVVRWWCPTAMPLGGDRAGPRWCSTDHDRSGPSADSVVPRVRSASRGGQTAPGTPSENGDGRGE